VIVVPSGAPPDLLPSEPPTGLDRSRDAPVILWAGGAYPWFDLENVAQACALVLEHVPNVRFIFAGVHGRDETLGSQQWAAQEFHKAVEAMPKLAASSEFVPWVPYRDRAQLYAAADLAISVHGAHAETFFSMRTRVLDFVGAALPVVMTGGDAISESLASEGAARVVPPNDAGALAYAVIDLLDHPDARLAVAAAMRRLAQGSMSWDAAIQPLVRRVSGAQTTRSRATSPASPKVVSAPPVAWRKLEAASALLVYRARCAITQRLAR
jgi:glycosyltransferase involved in cell wall biosynthesis